MMGRHRSARLTCSVIIEEGFPRQDLERILASMREACHKANARVLTSDTKVMGKGVRSTRSSSTPPASA